MFKFTVSDKTIYFFKYNTIFRSYNGMVNQIWKRGSMLNKLIEDKDRKKNWHFEILKNSVKSKNVFEKVHRPSKRQTVLNSLFIKNITDVLSTGDIAPEILGSNIEITGVKISPCCRILNVYWQIPPHNFESHEEIATTLNKRAPRIRAELISRNLMGRVPQIFFVRDITNAFLDKFQKALKKADLGPEKDSTIIPDDSFTENLYSFKEAKVDRNKETKASFVTAKQVSQLPIRPPDMKSDVFGLRHDALMKEVIEVKTKSKSKTPTHVILAPEWPEDSTADLFDKIPGTSLHSETSKMDREMILKQFHIQRKMMKKQTLKDRSLDSAGISIVNVDYDEPDEIEVQDFHEEDTTERF